MGKTWIDGKCFFVNLKNRAAVFQWNIAAVRKILRGERPGGFSYQSWIRWELRNFAVDAAK